MIKPLRDHVLVRPIVNDMSPGGIYVGNPKDTGQVKEIVYGEVLAVGPGAYDKRHRTQSMWGLKPGDQVGYSPVCQAKLKDLVMIKRDAVIGILEEA